LVGRLGGHEEAEARERMLAAWQMAGARVIFNKSALQLLESRSAIQVEQTLQADGHSGCCAGSVAAMRRLWGSDAYEPERCGGWSQALSGLLAYQYSTEQGHTTNVRGMLDGQGHAMHIRGMSKRNRGSCATCGNERVIHLGLAK
jgi:hypothetical protein